MHKTVEMALIGSSSALGLNWIYDRKLLNEFSSTNSVLFLPIQHELYKKAEHGFDVYPTLTVGDLDFMGEVVYIYQDFLENNQDINLKEYFYNHFGPNSSYVSYIEKYGKVLIEEINSGKQESSLEDKQLIGTAMIVTGLSFTLEKEVILKHVEVLTSYDAMSSFYDSLEYIFNNLTKETVVNTLEKSIDFLPSQYQKACKCALSTKDVYEFIDTYSGVACGLDQSYPLIYFILSHSTSFKDALILNASLGGASSARGIMIGAILSNIEDLPKEYENILNKRP